MIRIMSGEQDGARLAVSEVVDQLEHHLLVTEIQRRAGLIQQDILTGADQRAGNQHQLLLAAGERVEVIPGQGGNPQLRQRLLNPPGILLVRLGKEIHVPGAAHQHHIAHSPAESGTKRLRNQGDAALALRPAAQRWQHAGQGIQQSTFSPAIGAQHRPDLAGTAGQRERGEERLTVAVT